MTFVIKDTIIIECSEGKKEGVMPAFDLYKGALNAALKTFDKNDVFDNFNVFYLSAKFGLVSAQEKIPTYDKKMPTTQEERDAYIKEHKRNAQAQIKAVASKDARCFLILSKRYKVVFDDMKLSALNSFSMVYQGEGSRGIGDYRGRLKKIINTKLRKHEEPILFRSGCSNLTEITAFRLANSPIGTSLAYTTNKKIFAHAIDNIKLGNPTFIDNGMITAISKGTQFKAQEAIEKYLEIVNGLKDASSLHVVIPDEPYCNNRALNIIKAFKSEIRQMAKKCEVIIPIHKEIQLAPAEQVKAMTDILGESTMKKVTLGFPTRVKGKLDWRLSIRDIESIYVLKTKNDEQLIRKAHFLALSDATRGSVYEERKALCEMYNVKMSCDACRITA